MRNTLLALAALLVTIPACATHDGRYRWDPAPSVTAIGERGRGTEPVARTLVSVVGVRLADRGHSDEVEIRLRIESTGAERVTLDPSTLRLTAGDLRVLALTRSDPAELVSAGTAAAGLADSAQLTAWFALPSDYDRDEGLLDGLLLDWRVEFPGGTFAGTSTFQLRHEPYRYYGDPYPYPYPFPIHSHRFHRHGWHSWGCY